LAEKSVENANKLLLAKEGSQLDVVQLEVDLERYRAELEATEQSLPAAFRRLAASVGVNNLPFTKVEGDLDTALSEYNLDKVRSYVLGIHPELRSAQIGVERAQLILKRATPECYSRYRLCQSKPEPIKRLGYCSQHSCASLEQKPR
jgi:outer membrane protein, heavy metal efflux system